MRDGTRKSRAPSGVDFVRIGVSTSRKSSSCRTSRIAMVTALRATNLRVISGRLRSRYRYLSRRSSDALIPSSIGNGGVSARFRIARDVAPISMAPVGRSGFTASAPRATTVPVTSTTNSFRSSLARARSAASGRSSASNTTWARPERSRRSMKTSSPWSRRRLTQPCRRTVWPTCEGRRVPAGVRERADMAGILQTRPERLHDRGPRQLFLRARREDLEEDRAGGALLLAEQEGERGAGPLGDLEAGAGALRRRHEIHGDASAPQLAREGQRVAEILPVERDERHAAHGVDRFLPEPVGQHVHEAVLADREADPRRLRPAEVEDELVVAPAAEQRVLRAEAGGSDLEDGARVVVEAADQEGVFFEWNAGGTQERDELAVVRIRGRIERRQQIGHARELRRRDELLDGGVLRVEDAQRVVGKAPPVVFAERSRILIRRKKRPNGLDVRGPRGFGSNRIERDREAREAEPPQEVEQHDEHFGVRR